MASPKNSERYERFFAASVAGLMAANHAGLPREWRSTDDRPTQDVLEILKHASEWARWMERWLDDSEAMLRTYDAGVPSDEEH